MTAEVTPTRVVIHEAGQPKHWGDFGPVKKALRGSSIPALFQVVGGETPVWGFTSLTVKQAGIALIDPTKTAPENWMASCITTGHLVAALRVREEFQTSDHSEILRYGRGEVRKRN